MRLRFTPAALADLDHVLSYIAEHSPQDAHNVRTRIQATINLALAHPKAGARTSLPGMRRLVVSPYTYLVFYRIGEDEIVIHGVRHSARRPKGMPG